MGTWWWSGGRSELGAVVVVVGLGAVLATALAMAVGCGSGPLALNAPAIAHAQARSPSPVELEPIVTGAQVLGDFMAPGPASVLTAAMNEELRGRALHGGESGGYAVRCTLDRFAARSRESMTESQELLTLYVDLSCQADRAADHVPVWLGELRARTCSVDPNVLGSDASARQRLLDRALSDAARELASDLAIRALGLAAEPSARVFADETQLRTRAGLDDSPFGPAALQETAGSSDAVRKGLTDGSAGIRAAAWNAAAMAAGPGDAWTFGAQLALDDDPAVRFAQYKAFARLGSPESMQLLRGPGSKEGDSLLAELVADALRSGGTGLARTRR